MKNAVQNGLSLESAQPLTHKERISKVCTRVDSYAAYIFKGAKVFEVSGRGYTETSTVLVYVFGVVLCCLSVQKMNLVQSVGKNVNTVSTFASQGIGSHILAPTA